MYTSNSNNMTTNQLLAQIDTIIQGIEGDRYTIENLNELRREIIKNGITN